MLTLSEFACDKSNAIKYNGSHQTIVLGQDFQFNGFKFNFFLKNVPNVSLLNSKSELQTNKS